jgi:hypothetical protein
MLTGSRFLTPPRLACACACALPLGCWVLAAYGANAWAPKSVSSLNELTGDALLWTAACAIAAAPIHGLQTRAYGAQLLVPVAIFVSMSVVLAAAAHGTWQGVVSLAGFHVALLTVILALSAIGMFCRRIFRDELDAALCAMSISVTAALAILFAGPIVADMTASSRHVAMLASPLVALAATAHVDIIRLDIFYRISPLAHVTVDYPAWQEVAASYVGVTGLLVIAMLRFPGPSGERAPLDSLSTSHTT